MSETHESDAASPAPPSPPPPPPTLVRGLSTWDGALLTIGSIVGTGIFITTADMAKVLPHPGLILLVWLAGGLLTLAGALTYGELGAMFPRAGGLYHFAERDSAHACAGSAGALIPPFEHHVLANAHPDSTSLTLHIYGGEMDRCDIFQPEGDDRYRRCSKRLAYDE